jgi:glucose-1-phosphate thymidylyltransferase
MKGIILAGGAGSRLHPVTIAISKQIIPIYDKPMIYYPLSVLMLAEIREILIISTPRDIKLYKELFGTGQQLGLSFSYAIQEQPNGLAEAFIIGEDFIGNDNVCLVLGDNVFYGHGLTDILQNVSSMKTGATIFGYQVTDPERYGVVEFDENNIAINIEEKPQEPKSNYAVPGLYFYDNDVVKITKNIKPSSRGELEITSVNNVYLKEGKLKVQLIGRGIAWLDTGTNHSLLDASNYVHAIQHRQGQYVSCIEEIAYKKGFIGREKLAELAKPMSNSEYGRYLMSLLGGQ